MPSLALEWSSSRLSVALRMPHRDPVERSLLVHRFRSNAAFGLLQELLQAEDCPPDAVDRIVLGVGPGNYSGLRMAAATATGWSAPGGVSVLGLSSGRALLAHFLAQGKGGVRVAGDARRGRLWTAMADSLDAVIRYPPRWELVPHGNFPTQPRSGIQLSPDAALDGFDTVHPTALHLLALAEKDGVAFEPPFPVYLQAPVAS